jgi:hypothetical protein
MLSVNKVVEMVNKVIFIVNNTTGSMILNSEKFYYCEWRSKYKYRFKKNEKLPLSILTNQMKALSVFEDINIKRSNAEANGILV